MIAANIKRELAGLCYSCDTPVREPGDIYCRKHSSDTSNRHRALLNRKCGDCGASMEYEGVSRCLDCRDKRSSRIVKAKKEGICTRCFRKPAAPDFARCSDCHKRALEQRRRQRSKS